MSGPEIPVELRLKRLEDYGFKVLKFVTPGHTGVHDRLILWPKWSPGPPVFVECKASGKKLRPLQAELESDFIARGCDVRPFVDTVEKAQALIGALLIKAVERNINIILPWHIKIAYKEALNALR